MQALFDDFIKRLPYDIRDRLQSAVRHQTDMNPNDRLHKGVCLVLKEVLGERKRLNELLEMPVDITKKGKTRRKQSESKKRKLIKNELVLVNDLVFQLASLSCYLVPMMKATEDYLVLLDKIDHPFIELFITYFQEDPSNYQETRDKFDSISAKLTKHSSFNEEMNAFIMSIKSWIYGKIGDATVLKSIFKYIKKHLPKSTNLVEIRGLQDAATNVIWWLLHSGVEANIKEMIDFIEPNIFKYRLYMSFTDYLNLTGAVSSYFGDNTRSIHSFEKLVEEHKKYHDNYRLSIAIGNLSESYLIEGKIIQARDMMEQAIQLYKESTGKWPYLYLTEIGNLYYLTGDPRAEESFLHAYEIQKKESTMFKAFILFELIHYYLRTEQLDKAKPYLSVMQNLTKELQTISVNSQLDYLLGYLEMLEQNFSNAIKYMRSSLELARQARDFDLILSSNIQLAALYLQRYRINEQPSFLNETLNHLDIAIQLAIENKHNQILALGLVIRALLSASKGEFEKSEEDMKQVRFIEKEIDYDIWKEDLDKIEVLIGNAQREGQMELERYNVFKYILPQFKSMLSFKLVERKPKESTVLGLFIISESGVPIYTKLGSSLNADKMIISGLLTAIHNLSDSVVAGKDKGRLREVLYEDLWITVQPIKNGIVAVIASEATADIRLWADTIATKVGEVPVVITELKNELEVNIQEIIEQMNIK
jgi:tetratricopeptide (TPR) repeat protein